MTTTKKSTECDKCSCELGIDKIKTIPNDCPGLEYISFKPGFSAICSVGHAPFYGTVEICFRPGNKLLEFESVENWIREHSNLETTIEGYAYALAKAIYDSFGGYQSITVTATAFTIVHGEAKAVVSLKSNVPISF